MALDERWTVLSIKRNSPIVEIACNVVTTKDFFKFLVLVLMTVEFSSYIDSSKTVVYWTYHHSSGESNNLPRG